MTTVLPYSVDPDAQFHLSLFFTHRLTPGTTLADFPTLATWPAALRAATIELHINDQPDSLACTPLTAVLSDAAWQAAFPGTTPVGEFTQPTTTDADWTSYPASAMPEHAIHAHYSSVFSSPVTPPTVTRSRLARSVLDHLSDRSASLRDAVRDLDNDPADKRLNRERLLHNLAKGARDACSYPAGSAGLVSPAPRRNLLDRDDDDTTLIGKIDESITQLLDSPPPTGHGEPAVEGVSAVAQPSAIGAMLRDAHATLRFYHRPAENSQTGLSLVRDASPARPTDIPPEFHSLATAAGNIPALARQLGFVLDLTVADPQALATATTIHCVVRIPDVDHLPAPRTLCRTEGSAFLAQEDDSKQWDSGYLTVGTPKYRVLDLDPDASGLKLEQHLRGVLRAYDAERNGDPGNYAPASLRSTGFVITHTDSAPEVRDKVMAAERRNDDLDRDAAPDLGPFRYDDLVRGLRVEVWDDATRGWHSLHDRTVSVNINDSPLLRDTPDAGLLQNRSLSRAPGSPDNPYYLHEEIAGWDGWSLSAPRPWLSVTHDSGQGGSPGREMIGADPESRPGAFAVRSVVAGHSLPALRYGRRYSFRVLGVDLAGNSVPHDMEAALAEDVDQAKVTDAIAHLAELRGQAADRDSRGLLEEQRTTPTLGAPPPQSGFVGRVHDAMAAIETAAEKNLITRPNLDVAPSEFAALYAHSGSDDTVTTLRLFLRWDPVPEPAVVPRRRFTTGESVHRVVIRGIADTTTTSERHLVPPKTSQLEAELDGCFDDLMMSDNPADRRRAYAIALKERGSLFSTDIQDLDDPSGVISQPGISLETSPTADPSAVVTLAELQDPERQPAAGQYVVHDTDELVIPYLPDPMARGVALVFFEAGADHHLSDRRVLQTVVVPYTGTWPQVDALRLVVCGAPELNAAQNGNEIRVGLPPGEQVGVAISSTLDPEHLDRLGLWRFHAVHNAEVTEPDRKVLEQAALDGWLWWLTPSRDLRLVHATPGPARPPMITTLAARTRDEGKVGAELCGTLDIHGASTDAVELRAVWIDWVDDPGTEGPVQVTRKAIVAKLAIASDETVSVLAVTEPVENARSSGVPERPVIHTLPDTRYRTVEYRLHGSSRFREFFERNELPDPDDLRSAGNPAAVTHLSSQAPPPPMVHDVIPLFFWEEHHEPHHPFALRRIRRGGVRIWLDRPWYASGDGEVLGIVTDPGNDSKLNPDVISLWGRDPTLFGPSLPTATGLPLLPAPDQRVLELNVDPRRRPGRPYGRAHIVKPSESRTLHAYLYQPEFHPVRRRWFVDALFDAADAAWPFLRLNLIRYQPNSIDGDAVSTAVNTDFVQLLPERITTLSRPDAGTVRVTVSGTFATDLSAQEAAVARVKSNRQVRASLQTLNSGAKSDLDWTTVHQVDCDVEGVDPQTFAATWSAALPLDNAVPLATPGDDRNMRVLVEELESLPTDPEPGSSGNASISRLIYADHLYL